MLLIEGLALSVPPPTAAAVRRVVPRTLQALRNACAIPACGRSGVEAEDRLVDAGGLVAVLDLAGELYAAAGDVVDLRQQSDGADGDAGRDGRRGSGPC